MAGKIFMFDRINIIPVAIVSRNMARCANFISALRLFTQRLSYFTNHWT